MPVLRVTGGGISRTADESDALVAALNRIGAELITPAAAIGRRR